MTDPTDEQVTRFDQWWCSSKYLQVIKPVCGWRDIAWDSWRAAQAAAPLMREPTDKECKAMVHAADVFALKTHRDPPDLYDHMRQAVRWAVNASAAPPPSAPTPAADDLVRRLRKVQGIGAWLRRPRPLESLDVTCASAADRIEQQAAEIARLTKQVATMERSHIAGGLATVVAERNEWKITAERAEAEIARLRAVVRAADAMRADAYQEDMSSVGCPTNMVDRPTSVALAYDDARKEAP